MCSIICITHRHPQQTFVNICQDVNEKMMKAYILKVYHIGSSLGICSHILRMIANKYKTQYAIWRRSNESKWCYLGEWISSCIKHSHAIVIQMIRVKRKLAEGHPSCKCQRMCNEKKCIRKMEKNGNLHSHLKLMNNENFNYLSNDLTW